MSDFTGDFGDVAWKTTPYEDLKDELLEVDVMQPVYDDTGRIIGYNATGDINDPLEKDYSSLWEQLDVAKDMGIPDIDTWMTEQGYDFYDPMAREETGDFTDQTMYDMQQLIDSLTSGPTAMELGQATAYAEQTMGLAPGTYAEIVGGLRTAADTPIEEMQGMSDEERAARERYNRNELRQMEQTAGRLIDNIKASSGSVARAYATADQAISQINDAQLQQTMTMYNDDYMRKSAESDKAMQRYQLAVQNGQMSQAQYLEVLTQNKSMALQGYATQVTTMMQQNQQYLQMYQADSQAIMANIDNIYKAIQMEIGIDEKALSDIERAYDREMAPLLLEMDLIMNDLALKAASDAQSSSDLMGFLSLGVSLLTIPLTGGLSVLGWGASQILSPPATNPALSTIGPG